MNVTAIENFFCVIYNISFMNCTWHVDRNASGDTQYFLYWKTSRKEDFLSCQNYIKDNCGRHTGCRFQNVTIEGSSKAYFLVNESRNGQNILPYRKTIYLYEIEKLTPPLNVTVNCTGVSHSCEIQWQPPRTSRVHIGDTCFKYEIVIEKKADPEEGIKTTSKMERNITGNSYIFDSFSAKKRYSVKLRATNNHCSVSENWGEWSTPVEFGREQLTSISSYTLLLISVVAASLVLFLCIVTIYLKTVPATVLQPKDLFHDISPVNFQTENQLIKHETEEIITIIEEAA
ncbi:granulocyte-macrophage colony-stimulating factor receptor subunit alpha-like [Numida meleagris]|uniref:granulocyte-macrophage colony-stimulating factor receptor subunit alpha-like n=1 Tax=Numida meleagris TaxID=8996 RepID=UPI000B3DAB77|nr:granulocyte-macrophage colony-stimulating factor receptor subunit alpha-like [Numida meleagris]XP_021267441.1 granulocyte-macrophage colony-stimulating factor receptor subunit alpha-like [Numida meleagris]